jgi:hypothetical protein
MDAKIMILSGKSGRGQEMGCTGYQVYAVVAGASGDLYTSGPCDDHPAAQADAQKWAADNGVEIVGNVKPRAVTGSSADRRINSPRY